MSKELTLTIKGFTSPDQVEEFCDWYSGQGEQDLSIWFEYNSDTASHIDYRKHEVTNEGMVMTVQVFEKGD